jgi:nucleotide-binding universal stress UspA family protein
MKGMDVAQQFHDVEEAPRSEPRPRRRRVLVALHGRWGGIDAIALGRLVAGALNKPLHGLYTSEAPVPPTSIREVLRLPPDALEGVVLDVAVGDPIERLVAAVEEHPTAFVIIGAEPSAGGELGLGDFVTRALEVSSAPLLIVRPGARARIDRILVPLDGTPSTAIAVQPAGELARELAATLDIVLVGEAGHAPQEEPGAMAAPQYVDQPHHEWPAFASEFLHRNLTALGHCPPDVPTRFYLGAGRPADEILRYAETLGSDLMVLVWHGRATDEHAGVFKTVLKRASCPVLVLRC